MLFLFTMVFVQSAPDPTVESILMPAEGSSLLQVEAQHYPETTHTIHTTYKPLATTHTINHNWDDEPYTNIDGVGDGTLDDGQIDDGSSTSVLSSWYSLRDATIVASSSITQDSLPENLKGPAHSIWVSATDAHEWLTIKFPNGHTVDGIRVWNVKSGFFFKSYIIQMSENDGHNWYNVKEGATTTDMECCSYYEIRFPVVHANMFKLLMTDTHLTATQSNEKTMSLSYIEFHFLPDPDILCPYYAVPFKGYCYAVMDRALFSVAKMTSSSCQSAALSLPLGWTVAVFSDEVVENVVKSPIGDSNVRWGTQFIVFVGNEARKTTTGLAPTSDDITTGVHFEVSKFEDKYSVLVVDDPPSSTTQVDCLDVANQDKIVEAKVFMQTPWNNSTTRYNPPFVSRSDTYNNFVFERS